MVYAVYLPLFLSVVAACCAGPVTSWLRPRVATWTLTAFAIVLAVCGTVSLALLAATHRAAVAGASGVGR